MDTESTVDGVPEARLWAGLSSRSPVTALTLVVRAARTGSHAGSSPLTVGWPVTNHRQRVRRHDTADSAGLPATTGSCGGVQLFPVPVRRTPASCLPVRSL